jgi:hypothetical protein
MIITPSQQKKKKTFVLRMTFRNFVIIDDEITPSRQKKRMISFVLRSTFRNFVGEKDN